MASVIIPAHNESGVIDRCLHSILQEGTSKTDAFEVIVVCNGCSDDTALRAKKYPNVTVVEITEASKIKALNKGDSVAASYPRVYLDADIEISSGSLKKAIEIIQSSEILAASPKAEFDLTSSNIWVKSFYAIWTKLPYFSRGKMIGSGIYILSEEGRARFTSFPDLVSDDGFIRSLFSDHERQTLNGCHFKIFVPHTLIELIKIKRRSAFGNRELSAINPNADVGRDNTAKDLLVLITKKPWLIPAAIVYLIVKLRINSTNRKALSSGAKFKWERDMSSRA